LVLWYWYLATGIRSAGLAVFRGIPQWLALHAAANAAVQSL